MSTILKYMCKNNVFGLFILYFSVVIVKFLIEPLILCPTIFFDEVIYLRMALNNLLGNQVSHYPPLYPFIISVFPSDSVQISYHIAKSLNIFISSLIIFPTYFISQFFLNRRLSLIIGFFSLLIPIGFTYSFLIMSENLFYPLFFLSVYLVFKSEKEDKKWLYSFSGIIMGFAVLTRIIGLVLIVVFMLYLLYKYLLYKKYDTKQTYTIITFLTVLFPLYFLKGILHEFSEQGTLGFISLPFKYALHNIFDAIIVINSHFVYLILGGGVVLGLLSLVELYEVLKNKEKTLFGNFTIFSWLYTLCTIIVCGIFLSGEYRVASRYIAFLIPLFFIMGFKSLDRWDNIKRKIFILAAFFIFFISFFLILVQGNETEIFKCYSICHLLSLKNIILFEFLIIFVFVLVFFLPKIEAKKRRGIAKYALISFLCFLLVSGVINDFNDRVLGTQKSFNNEIIGKYLAVHNGSVVYDEDLGEYEGLEYYFWKVWFMNNGKISIGKISSNGDFFISSKNLSYQVMVQQELDYINDSVVLFLYKK